MAFKPTWILYGATGAAGSMIARAAVSIRSNVVLAGRNENKLRRLADELGVTYRTIDLDERDAMANSLSGVRLVLNCASPFELSSTPIALACIRNGAHYLDIGGGMADHRALLRIEDRAKEAGVAMCPGVGFEVMLSDLLAQHLKRRLPSAVRLDLGVALNHATMTRTRLGDLRAALAQPGYRVISDELVPAPAKTTTRPIDFAGGGKRRARSFPWRADALTASRSTGIDHIEFWAAYPFAIDQLIAWHKAFEQGPLKRLMEWQTATLPPMPPAKEMQHGRSYVWGEAVSEVGNRVSSVLECPSTYRITGGAAMLAVKLALTGELTPGFITPSQLVGSDALARFKEVTCVDR